MTESTRKPLQSVSVSQCNIVGPLPGTKSTIAATPKVKHKCRPGPKPKPLQHRVIRLRPPIQRVERSYTRERKIEVLIFLLQHQIPINPQNPNTSYRQPTQREASAWFKIPQQSIANWWRDRLSIVDQKIGSRRAPNSVWHCLWPALEVQLFEQFVQQRLLQKVVRRSWFRQQSKRLFKELYSETCQQLFVFSHAWFNNFQRRWGISCRAITKKASKLPAEYEKLVQQWLQFNRRNSLPRNSIQQQCLLNDQVGRFSFSHILNLDETPIPFEYLDGRTFDFVGNKTISAKTHGNGWDKRQATLILYIFADGIPRIKPKLIFHETSERPTGVQASRIRRQEGSQYHPDVSVEFNPTAYNNELLFLKFIDEELIPTLHSDTTDCTSKESLLLLDAAGFHTTDAVLSKLRAAKIIPSLIPGGCTGLLQPLDTAVNKPFKDLLRDITDAYVEEAEIENPRLKSTGWTISDKRVMTTHVVAKAWNIFSTTRSQLIQQSFRDVGVTLPVDGSEDHQLKIKGMPDVKITLQEENSNPVPLDTIHQVIPTEGDISSSLEFTWTVEDYFHTSPSPMVPNSMALLQSEFQS